MDMDTAPQYSSSSSTDDDSDSAAGSLESLSDVGQETPPQSDGDVLDKATEEALPSDEKIPLLQPRSYQLEMLEMSLERNVIVVMDTGSGKTHIATLRIAAQLERCQPDQYVWFLAPTVTLCKQQYDVLRLHLPSVQIRFLSGQDKPELWRNQSIWDDVLKNISVVVSTHDVLLGALSNGFVRIQSLALLVFDEAHHCGKKHPANLIMQLFYHPALKAGNGKVPHILGLTASPVMNLKPKSLQIVETNMNSISKTPKVHHEEFLKHANRPAREKLEYSLDMGSRLPTGLLSKLLGVIDSLDINEDPYVVELQKREGPVGRSRLEKVLRTRRTHCQDQIKSLRNKGEHINLELGRWAADSYISRAIKKLRDSIVDKEEWLGEWTNREKEYLMTILLRVEPLSSGPSYSTARHMDVSPKVEQLLGLLTREYNPSLTGLIFVQQRAECAVLAYLISAHPSTKELYRCGTYVGTSTNSQRKYTDVAELLDPRDQQHYLDDLREGRKNLIIATSVLEEGIDVSSCNLVICFNKPVNLKTFIQRRGRARKMQAKFVIMVSENDVATKARDWESLEEQMKAEYMDDLRELEEIEEPDDGKESYDVRLEISSTGALLTPINAVHRLYHFCNVLPPDPYVDPQPEFTIEDGLEGISAIVVLPTSVPHHVRRARSCLAWKTKRTARRDAAYQACLALYQEGLLNDHFLPLFRRKDIYTSLEAIAITPSIVDARPLLNPWVEIANSWRNATTVHSTRITIRDASGSVRAGMKMILPVAPPLPPAFDIYWDADHRWSVCSEADDAAEINPKSAELYSVATEALLQSVFRPRMETGTKDFVALFTPSVDAASCEEWLGSSQGCRPAEILHDNSAPNLSADDYGVVRLVTHSRSPHIFRDWAIREVQREDEPVSAEEDIVVEKLHVEATRWPKRTDLLHPVTANEQRARSVKYLLAQDCEVDNLPLQHSQFAFCVPSILHKYEVYLIADQLRKTRLARVQLQDLDAVVMALSASSAREGVDYQRLEFLGDSVLKWFVSLQLLAEHPSWHEGYLSTHKAQIVANPRLAQAAVAFGLDGFIMTEAFTGRRWRPLYRSHLTEPPTPKMRKMATKRLADIVEALMGAAYIQGGLSTTLELMQMLLPELRWSPLSERCQQLQSLVPEDVLIPSHFRLLQELVGHRFGKGALLVEAMTHPSYKADTRVVTYQRLEFLGDAILDQIVVKALWTVHPALPHHRMHLMRTALVNADFLAFLCMEHSVQEARMDIRKATTDHDCVVFRPAETKVDHYIWQYMRCTNDDIALTQRETVQRFCTHRQAVRSALNDGYEYPWLDLARICADKFFSDLMESILGAIYLDTLGDLDACTAFLERIGLMWYLGRLISCSSVLNTEGMTMEIMHPKEQLGMKAGILKLNYVAFRGVADPTRTASEKHVRGVPSPPVGCQVFLGGRHLATVEGEPTKSTAETAAAMEVLKEIGDARFHPLAQGATSVTA